MLQLLNDPDVTVRYQLALSLGEWDDPRAGQALGQLAQNNLQDAWVRAAVLSSAGRYPDAVFGSLPAISRDSAAVQEMMIQLIAMAVGSENRRALHEMLAALAPAEDRPVQSWQLAVLGSLMDSLNRNGQSVDSLSASIPDVHAAITRIKKVLADARSIAQDGTLDETTRAAAIALLGRIPEPTGTDLELLQTFLTPQTPVRLQTTALGALVRTRNPEVPELLLADWVRHSPSLRNAILGALLARDEWIERLLDAIEKRVIAPAEIPPANRQRLFRHGNETIRKRAGELLGGNPSSNRAEVLAKYQGVVALAGDAARGEAVFAKNCSICHAWGGQGHAVGPDLTAFRAKSPQDFLVAILDPNAAIEPRFINYQIETKDGRSLSGVVKAESSTSLTLAQGGGLEEKILRSDIAEIRASNLSLMPEGLEQGMTPQDLADLIAYLKQSR